MPITQPFDWLVSLRSTVSLLSVFSFAYSGGQSATAKLIEIICFANFAIFHVCLIQIYIESKYLKKLWGLDSNTEGFESKGFYIPLYASLITINSSNLTISNYPLNRLNL